MIKARIIKQISNRYSITWDHQQVFIATAMGKLRKGVSPVVGDWVMVEQLEDKWAIQEVLPRENQLTRPVIANVDQAFIVTSLWQPDFSTTLLDRLIFLVCDAQIQPVIIITKCDLVDSSDPVFAIIDEYKKAGYPVYLTGKGWPSDDIKLALKDKITVLTGQSGAGKSALINRIDSSLHLFTQETSKALGRGKHTTRHVELYPIAGGWVADTPGFSSLSFEGLSKERLSWIVPDFKPYLGQCKFRNCIHINEPGCAIKAAVLENKISAIRHQNYVDVCQIIDQGGQV